MSIQLRSSFLCGCVALSVLYLPDCCRILAGDPTATTMAAARVGARAAPGAGIAAIVASLPGAPPIASGATRAERASSGGPPDREYAGGQ